MSDCEHGAMYLNEAGGLTCALCEIAALTAERDEAIQTSISVREALKEKLAALTLKLSASEAMLAGAEAQEKANWDRYKIGCKELAAAKALLRQAGETLAVYESLPTDRWPGPPTTMLKRIREHLAPPPSSEAGT